MVSEHILIIRIPKFAFNVVESGPFPSINIFVIFVERLKLAILGTMKKLYVPQIVRCSLELYKQQGKQTFTRLGFKQYGLIPLFISSGIFFR